MYTPMVIIIRLKPGLDIEALGVAVKRQYMSAEFENHGQSASRESQVLFLGDHIVPKVIFIIAPSEPIDIDLLSIGSLSHSHAELGFGGRPGNAVFDKIEHLTIGREQKFFTVWKSAVCPASIGIGNLEIVAAQMSENMSADLGGGADNHTLFSRLGRLGHRILTAGIILGCDIGIFLEKGYYHVSQGGI